MLGLIVQDAERRHRHLWILLVALLLAGIGLLFVRSTCYVAEGFPLDPAWRRQAQWGLLGLLLCVVFAMNDFRRLGGLVWVGYLASVLLLAVTLLAGVKSNGAYRWLKLPGLPSFQAAAPARLFTLLAYAAWLSRPPVRLQGRLAGLVGAALVLVPATLIAVEPSMGNALTLVCACSLVWFVARGNAAWARRLALTALLAAAVAMPALGWVRQQNWEPAKIRAALSWWPYKHHVNRVVWFCHPTGHPSNERQIMYCLASGGWFGKGLFRGIIQKRGFLPRAVAGSDFILATIGEEAGLLGCITVLMLCAVLVVLCLRVAAETTDDWGRLICTGVAALFAVQVLISVGMVLRLCPIIGLTIPLLGRAGTLMTTAFVGLGLVASVQRHTVPGTGAPQVLCHVSPPPTIMYRENRDTVVIDLLPWGPIKLFLRLRWERAAETLEELVAMSTAKPKPAKPKRPRKPKQYHQDTRELPGFRDALEFGRRCLRRHKKD